MAYDEYLGERISNVLKEKHVRYETRNMMGGLCFMVNDKMAMGVIKNSLLARIDPEIYQSSLKKKGCRPMDFTGRVMKGFVCVDPLGIDNDKDLEYWIQVSLDFNPKAKSSKKTSAV
ncbi:MAG TPA: TfoX/Sxy family protein [Chryseosolibacter sp.]|nr:TfoX/Sxy family protein [Chryseosolibacter sp.]